MLDDPRGDREVIEDLYSAALGERPWEHVARSMMRAFSGHTLLLMEHQPLFQLAELVGTQGLPEETLATYAARYASHDVWVRAMEGKRLVDRAVVGPELIADSTLERTEFYYDFLRPRVPVFHVTCGLLTLGGGRRAILGIHRPRDAPDFSGYDVVRMGGVLKHIRSALFLRAKLREARALASTAFAALDRLTTGLLILDQGARATHVNPAADAILQARDGLVLRNGVPHVLRAHEDRRLRDLIAGIHHQTGSAAGGRMHITRPSGRTAYSVVVTPATHGLSSTLTDRTKLRASALVFIADPERRSVRTRASLEARFGFPPAEARLVHALIDGQSLPTYARTAGVSYNTAKTQLARALSRTNTNSQLDLLRLVYSTDLEVATG